MCGNSKRPPAPAVAVISITCLSIDSPPPTGSHFGLFLHGDAGFIKLESEQDWKAHPDTQLGKYTEVRVPRVPASLCESQGTGDTVGASGGEDAF